MFLLILLSVLIEEEHVDCKSFLTFVGNDIGQFNEKEILRRSSEEGNNFFTCKNTIFYVKWKIERASSLFPAEQMEEIFESQAASPTYDNVMACENCLFYPKETEIRLIIVVLFDLETSDGDRTKPYAVFVHNVPKII